MKPENIFLSHDGQVKILDFGLTSVLQAVESNSVDSIPTTTALTRVGAVMRTMGYMSPEQVRAESMGRASDIFSLGCVLYEMVTGRRAFARPTPAATMTATLSDDPLIAVSQSGIPIAFLRLIGRCLAKSSRERFQSAGDLTFALNSLFHEEHNQPAISSKGNERRQAIVAGTGFLVLVFFVVLGGYWLLTRNAPPTVPIDSAVLPLAHESDGADIEDLTDGIAEGLINSLSQVPRLRVMARTTMLRYRGSRTDPRQIARDLSVRAVFAGRVVRRADILRIEAELVDVESGARLWGETYNRPIGEILAVQGDITQRITEGLQLRLTGADQQRLAKHPTQDAMAHELYLKGRTTHGN